MDSEEIRLQLFREVVACTKCPLNDTRLLRDDAFNLPQPGYVGSNYLANRVLLIGQNPGVSPARFAAQDLEYARLQSALRDKGSSQALRALEAHIRRILPTWPVCGNYFPLAECGLTLEDIAYFNLARCRTRGNAAPSNSMVTNCTAAHLRRWIEALAPSVIVCIGKWAFSNLPAHILKQYCGRIAVMNRQRSLATDARRENVRETVDIVGRRGISPKAVEFPGDPDSVVRTAPPPTKLDPVAFIDEAAHHDAEPSSRALSTRPREKKTVDQLEFKAFYKSGKFSHTEIRVDGEPFAHCTSKSTNIFPRFRHSGDTRRKLVGAGFAEKYNEGDQAYRFFGVNFEKFCELFEIEVPPTYKAE